jgi:hypothetical protein
MPHEIRELTRLLSQASLTKADVSHFMVQVRQLIESQAIGPSYPTLKRYCNWIVHPALDRKEYYSLLEALTDAVLAHKDKPPDTASFQAITDVFGPKQLQEDFKRICSAVGIPDVFCTDAGIWREFFGMIASNLVDKPIQFQDPAVMSTGQKAVYDAVRAKAGSTSFAVKGFWLFCKGPAPDVGELWWCIDLIPRATAIPKAVQLTGKFAWPK